MSMKLFRSSTFAFAVLSASSGASSATIEGASKPVNAEWVFRRQAARTHMRELVGDEVMRELVRTDENLASLPIHAAKPKAFESRPQPKPVFGRSQSRQHGTKEVPAAHPDPNLAAERIAGQEKLADELSLWRKTQKKMASSKPAAAPGVHVKRVAKSRTPMADKFRSRRLADQKAREKADGVKEAVKEVKVRDFKVKEEKVDGVKFKMKVNQVKVLDVRVKEEPPKAQAAAPKEERVDSEKVKVTDVKVRDVKVKEAQPDSSWNTGTQPAALSLATSQVLSCVCGGKFAKGDRIRYLGHAFPPGRTAGTILAGTKNGYLNIDWDDFHEGHTGNCELSACGGCETSAESSRWFTPCAEVGPVEA